jgi:hypothetical protein
MGMGACARTGTVVCDAAGTGTTCNATAGTPTTETCNGVDDDCDGMIDDGFALGTACDGADPDLCTEGMIVCAPAAAPPAPTSAATRSSCATASTTTATPASTRASTWAPSCDGGDTDACAEGVLVCGPGGVAVCNDATSSTVETCNGLDDDCQGGVDNGFAVGGTCTTGVGACARTGTNVCNAAGNGVQCNATAGSPTAETCGDGIDQDCNGSDAVCPTNDQPGGAINISAGGTFTADLTAARNDQDFSGSFCGSTGGRDVYYTFTLPAAEVVYLDTFGSNFDTDLRVFAGSCTALGALQSCFDDQCSVTQTQGALSLAAGTYCLVVDQFSSFQTSGALTLTLTRGGRTGTAISTGLELGHRHHHRRDQHLDAELLVGLDRRRAGLLLPVVPDDHPDRRRQHLHHPHQLGLGALPAQGRQRRRHHVQRRRPGAVRLGVADPAVVVHRRHRRGPRPVLAGRRRLPDRDRRLHADLHDQLNPLKVSQGWSELGSPSRISRLGRGTRRGHDPAGGRYVDEPSQECVSRRAPRRGAAAPRSTRAAAGRPRRR